MGLRKNEDNGKKGKWTLKWKIGIIQIIKKGKKFKKNLTRPQRPNGRDEKV